MMAVGHGAGFPQQVWEAPHQPQVSALMGGSSRLLWVHGVRMFLKMDLFLGGASREHRSMSRTALNKAE